MRRRPGFPPQSPSVLTRSGIRCKDGYRWTDGGVAAGVVPPSRWTTSSHGGDAGQLGGGLGLAECLERSGRVRVRGRSLALYESDDYRCRSIGRLMMQALVERSGRLNYRVIRARVVGTTTSDSDSRMQGHSGGRLQVRPVAGRVSAVAHPRAVCAAFLTRG